MNPEDMAKIRALEGAIQVFENHHMPTDLAFSAALTLIAREEGLEKTIDILEGAVKALRQMAEQEPQGYGSQPPGLSFNC